MRSVVFLAGLVLVGATLLSALKTVVLPRGVSSLLSAAVFRSTRVAFNVIAPSRRSFGFRDRVMALYSPVSLVVLPGTWVALVAVGYTAMFWAIDYGGWAESFLVSGSSLLTLGFAPVSGLAQQLLAFSEATLGLGIVALLITFLPSMYTAFSAREAMVALMDVRAGTPPSAVELLERAYRIGWLDHLDETWKEWETWFAVVQESHTSYPALNFLRSPHADMSWVTAAGTVLDAASLLDAAIDVPRQPHSNLTIRAGYVALRRICDYFGLDYPADPRQDDPIAVTRREFEEACDRMARAGLPIRPDRAQAWRDFAGWRVNYDTPLLRLAEVVMAPYAPWTSDRSAPEPERPVIRRWGRRLRRS